MQKRSAHDPWLITESCKFLFFAILSYIIPSLQIPITKTKQNKNVWMHDGLNNKGSFHIQKLFSSHDENDSNNTKAD